MGFILIQPNDLTEFQTHLALLLDEFEWGEMSLPQLPAFDLSLVENEWRKLRNNIPEVWKLNNNGLEFTVGEAIAARGLSAKHPVVLVPGIISTVRPPAPSRFRRPDASGRRASSRGRPRPSTARSSARRSGAASRCSPK